MDYLSAFLRLGMLAIVFLIVFTIFSYIFWLLMFINALKKRDTLWIILFVISFFTGFLSGLLPILYYFIAYEPTGGITDGFLTLIAGILIGLICLGVFGVFVMFQSASSSTPSISPFASKSGHYKTETYYEKEPYQAQEQYTDTEVYYEYYAQTKDGEILEQLPISKISEKECKNPACNISITVLNLKKYDLNFDFQLDVYATTVEKSETFHIIHKNLSVDDDDSLDIINQFNYANTYDYIAKIIPESINFTFLPNKNVYILNNTKTRQVTKTRTVTKYKEVPRTRQVWVTD